MATSSDTAAVQTAHPVHTSETPNRPTVAAVTKAARVDTPKPTASSGGIQ